MTHNDVRIAKASEQQTVLNTLMLAFATDPPLRYLFATPDAYLAGFPRFATAMGGGALAAGTAYLADGAAALWLPPGVESDQVALGALVAELVAPETLPVMGQVVEAIAHYHPHEPHWYLSLIGVDPARQGLGLGSAVLKETLQRCDADGLIAYLESSSPKNIPLYERHGFEVMGVIQPGDFPPLYPMLRPARR